MSTGPFTLELFLKAGGFFFFYHSFSLLGFAWCLDDRGCSHNKPLSNVCLIKVKRLLKLTLHREGKVDLGCLTDGFGVSDGWIRGVRQMDSGCLTDGFGVPDGWIRGA